eukprot:Transcript_13734.p2 GENE.Transcript_13734~~Transcript_13734.p2  ORF type:complete len:322 (-),score=126.53 Transcript_13734:51-902(-)
MQSERGERAERDMHRPQASDLTARDMEYTRHRWTPPDQYGLVESQVYRSAFLTPDSFAFIKLLNLRTVINLSQEVPVRSVLSFLAENGITLENIGLQVWTRMEDTPISQELIKEALQLVLDVSRAPLLVMSSSGTHQVGVLVGCLRRQQGWNLASVLDEYRSFSAPSARLFCEQFIELWDTDQLTVPSRPPSWWTVEQQMQRDDLAAWEALREQHAAGAGSKRVGASPLRRPASDGDQLSEMREYREARRFEAAAKASPDYFRVSGPLASPGTSTSMVDEEDD